MLLTVTQAQSAIEKVATKQSPWQSGAGCRFRVCRVPGSFDISTLPEDFEVMWYETNGDIILCEWEYIS